MMRYFVFSDVHGCVNELRSALNKAGFNPEDGSHFLLFLGDAFDHNVSGHFEMYCFLKEMIEKGKLKWMTGNHEAYLLSALDKMKTGRMTRDTIIDIASGLYAGAKDCDDIQCLGILKEHGVDKFIRNNCIPYFETENYVFTHGMIPYYVKDNRYDSNWRNISPARWIAFHSRNGMKEVLNGIKIPGKTLVCGHVGAYYGNITKLYPGIDVNGPEFRKIANKMMKNAKTDPEPFKIFYGDGVIGIDGRAYDTKNVNILVVDDEPQKGKH